MSSVSNNVSIPIQKGLVDNLALKKDTGKLTTYLRSKIIKDEEIRFDPPETYRSFVTLLKEKISVQDPGLYKAAFVFFHKKLGLAECGFNEDLILVGSDNTEIKLSSEVLKMLFDYFAKILSSGMRETDKVDGYFRISVELEHEALQAFAEYVNRGKFGTLSYNALSELINFAEMTTDETLKDAVGRKVVAHFCEDSNEAHVELQILSGYYAFFTQEYLIKKKVPFTNLPSGGFGIFLSDFSRLFQNKNSKICKILSDTISDIYLDNADYDLLNLIPAHFRRAILSVYNKSTVQSEVSPTEDNRTVLHKLFPNAYVRWNTNELKEAISKNPHDWFAHGRLGYVLRLQNKVDEAEAELRKAIALNDKDFFAHGRLGGVLRLQNKLDEAEAELRKAIALNDKDFFAHASLGDVLRQQNKLDEAEAELRRAIALNDKDFFAHGRLGDVLRRQNKLDEAEAELRRAIALIDKDFFAHGSLGDVLRQQNKLDEAEAELRRAIALNDKDFFAHGRLGDVLRQQNKLDEAEAELRRAIALNDKDFFAHGRLGDVLRLQNKLDEAEAELERASKMFEEYLREVFSQLNKKEQITFLEHSEKTHQAQLEIDDSVKYLRQNLIIINGFKKNLLES